MQNMEWCIPYHEKLIGRQVFSTNLMCNLSQGHEIEACQTEVQGPSWTVNHNVKRNLAIEVDQKRTLD